MYLLGVWIQLQLQLQLLLKIWLQMILLRLWQQEGCDTLNKQLMVDTLGCLPCQHSPLLDNVNHPTTLLVVELG